MNFLWDLISFTIQCRKLKKKQWTRFHCLILSFSTRMAIDANRFFLLKMFSCHVKTNLLTAINSRKKKTKCKNFRKPYWRMRVDFKRFKKKFNDLYLHICKFCIFDHLWNIFIIESKKLLQQLEPFKYENISSREWSKFSVMSVKLWKIATVHRRFENPINI